MSNIEALELQPTIQELVQHYARNPTNLLQILWCVQERYRYISESAIDQIATQLNLTRAHVQGVARFYSFFHATPRGKYDILFSDNIIDHMQGKQELFDYMLKKLRVQRGQPRTDERVSIDNTACIGMSDQGPAALVNGYTVTRLSKTRIDKMVELIETDVPLAQWPRDFFQVRNNVQRKHLLLGEHFESGSAIKVMLQQGVEATLSEIDKASLRGCGGAGFKTHTKWSLCRQAPGEAHYVICNADEGEPGTFKDRVLLQGYADVVFEGMTLCAKIIGARKGFLYLRGEYRYLLESLEATLERRREQGLLGTQILGDPSFSFDIEIHLGAGAYICGADTALIESLEGHRGRPRKTPPFPVTHGYLQQPTVVNNVETFALAAKILIYGGERFSLLGTQQSKGTKLLSISGDCDRPGVYEFPFGVTVREVLAECGAQEAQAVQNSGPAGTCVSVEEFDRRLCFEDLNTTGSFMIFNRERDILEVVNNFADFFVHESCGFCTPCRVGTSLMKRYVEKIYNGRGTADDLKEMSHLSHLIKTTSHCGLGMSATNHIDDTLKKFPHVYKKRFKGGSSLEPTFDLQAALEPARQITQRTDKRAFL